MTRRNRRRQRTFDNTFDLILTCTIGIMCLLASIGMFAVLYLMVALINTV